MPQLNVERLEKFCQFIFTGMQQADAFFQAGYSNKNSYATARRQAKRLLKRPYVVARLKELRDRAEDASVATVIERKRKLTEIIRGPVPEFVNPINAISELNKMEHIYEEMPQGYNDNRQYNIIVADEESRDVIKRIMSGEGRKRIDNGN